MSDKAQIPQPGMKAPERISDAIYKAPSSFAAQTGSASFERARLNDVTVAMMLRQNQTLENIIGQLATEKELYVKRIMELESIAPRKIVLPDGRVMAWQCPLELAPPMNTPNDLRERPATPDSRQPETL